MHRRPTIMKIKKTTVFFLSYPHFECPQLVQSMHPSW